MDILTMVRQCKYLKYDVISETLAGQIECGDQYLVKELSDGILIAVADGLGHGTDAAIAAKKALKTLDIHANESLDKLIKICDQELIETRGVALTIAHISDNHMLTYLGIGNVIGICWQFDEMVNQHKHSFMLEDGVVGYQLPPLIRSRNIAMNPGDIFIIATDGINKQFETENLKFRSPETIANYLFKTYRNLKDDGLIFVGKLS